jgi:hypothetical protein
MFDPIPVTITATTISNAVILIKALRDYSKNHTQFNNIKPLFYREIQNLCSLSDSEINESSIILHNNLLAQRGSAPDPITNDKKIVPLVSLTKSGRDLSEGEIEKLIIYSVQTTPPKIQSPNN